MIHKATALVGLAMEKAGIPCIARESGRISRMITDHAIPGGPSINLSYISLDEDNDVSIRAFQIVQLEDDAKKSAMLELINQLNCQYRFVRFTLDEANSVNLSADLPSNIPDEALGKVCCEMQVRIEKMLDDVYPRLQKVLVE